MSLTSFRWEMTVKGGEGMIEVNKDNFATEVLESKLPVLVDFWSPS
jgi:thioredoxin-like negative regulator of GroEL